MSDAVPQVEKKPEQPVEPKSGSKIRTARIIGLALIIFAVVLGWLLLVGYLGYQSGQQKMIEMQQEEFVAQVQRQLALAEENIDLGNHELALVRLDWILQQDPNNPQALQLQETAQETLAQSDLTNNESAQAVLEATPITTPKPSPTPGQIDSPEEELQRIRRQIVRKEWSESIASLIAFQLQFPSFERTETDQLLFDAYLGYSQLLLEGEDVELGLYYLNQAEKLGNLPQSMQDYRTWAELYTQGISFYGANWDAAAYYFRDLCLAAPFYQESCTKMYQALVANGDQYAAVQDWCPAVLLYEEAWSQNNNGELGEKLELARNGCLSATPTPAGPISGTVPLSGTQSFPGEPFVLPSPTP
jgi:hypothetical protein